MFPLPSNYFPRLQLTVEEAQAFQTWGNSLLQQTIDAYHREQFETQEQRERKWKPIKSKGELTAYRRRKIDDPDAFRYLCTGRIEGSFDEVVMGRYADTTEDFRRISAVYREDLVDCAVLHVLEKRSPSRPFYFAGFKWMTVKSPGKGLVKNRDVCWYEQMGLTTDRNGKEIGYTLTESVDVPTCPPFVECVRAKFSICYIYKRNKSGGVKVYMRGKNNAGGKVLDWVADLKSAELWLRIERAMATAQAVVASALVEAAKSTNSPIINHNKCAICHEKTKSIMSTTQECAVCHRYTCSRCIVKKEVLSTHKDFRKPSRAKFCKKCLRYIHEADLRDPLSVQNLVLYAASTISDNEQAHPPPFRNHSYEFDSEVDSQSGLEHDGEARYEKARSVHSSDSDRSFRHAAPPTISGRQAGVHPPPSPAVVLYNETKSGPRSVESYRSNRSNSRHHRHPVPMDDVPTPVSFKRAGHRPRRDSYGSSSEVSYDDSSHHSGEEYYGNGLDQSQHSLHSHHSHHSHRSHNSQHSNGYSNSTVSYSVESQASTYVSHAINPLESSTFTHSGDNFDDDYRSHRDKHQPNYQHNSSSSLTKAALSDPRYAPNKLVTVNPSTHHNVKNNNMVLLTEDQYREKKPPSPPPATIQKTTPNDPADVLMARMIEMNMMAENSQKLVEANDRLARRIKPAYY